MKPLLYTFRRCPYAIRARLAIAASGAEVETREVDLRNKPQALLDCSPKGTVPVLQLADGRVIEESLDIMRWALDINDPDGWMGGGTAREAEVATLLDENDGAFKRTLDNYKYAGRGQPEGPAHAAEHYRDEAAPFLRALSSRLATHSFLMGEQLSFADAAIVPFVRQFAHVDKAWFNTEYQGPLTAWLDNWLRSTLFVAVMQKEGKPTASARLS